MRGDKKFLEKAFEKFNRLIFKNPLPWPEMHITPARSFMGQFKVVRTGFMRKTESYHLTLSNRYDLPENVLEDIIIHEMIHFYIHIARLRDTSSHGDVFRKMMTEINRCFGRHVTISHRCTREQLDSDKRKAHSIICLCTMTDGRQLCCKASQSKIFEIYRAFEDWELVADQKWYWVYGSYFNRYRRVLTPKLFPIDADGIDKIKEGTRLEFTSLPDGRMSLSPVK